MDMSLEGRIRKDILDAAKMVGPVGAHIGPSLSLVEIVAAIYKEFNPKCDSIILSKGHGALGLYAVMHQFGIITDEQFVSFEQNGGEFPGQPSRSPNNQIVYSSGSLGMGLPYAIGLAEAKKQKGKVYVVTGDGELNEGSNWEGAMLARQLNLDNLTVIVDHNGMQSDGKCENILNVNIHEVWKAFGWKTVQCDGHSIEQLQCMLKDKTDGRPKVVIADTIKGKGISFMEGNNDWHHCSLSEEKYNLAVAELEETYGL